MNDDTARQQNEMARLQAFISQLVNMAQWEIEALLLAYDQYLAKLIDMSAERGGYEVPLRIGEFYTWEFPRLHACKEPYCHGVVLFVPSASTVAQIVAGMPVGAEPYWHCLRCNMFYLPAQIERGDLPRYGERRREILHPGLPF